jgi:hypothetical protein
MIDPRNPPSDIEWPIAQRRADAVQRGLKRYAKPINDEDHGRKSALSRHSLQLQEHLPCDENEFGEARFAMLTARAQLL